MTETESAAMPGPSQVRDRIANLIQWSDPGSPIEARLDKPGPAGSGYTPETQLPTVPQVRSVPDLNTVSQDATIYASMFEPLNRSLETFITKLSKSTEKGEKSRRTLKKPKSYKDESDGCIDTWIEVMKLHFEKHNLSKKQKCSALMSNLEGTALSCVMVKKTNERDSARNIFEILLNRFGSGVQGHQAMVKFEKRRQRDDDSIDKFLDDLELLRRRSNPDERISDGAKLGGRLEVHRWSKN